MKVYQHVVNLDTADYQKPAILLISLKINQIKKVLDLIDKIVLVTAGTTIEAIDEVRYISNHSSGKQGYLIAEEFANHGAEVILVSGPVSLKPPNKVNLYNVNTADEMLEISLKCLPVDIAVFIAAVADWKVEKPYPGRLRKK